MGNQHPGKVWDQIADSFLARLESGEEDQLLDALEKFEILESGMTVLEICCGPGWHLKQLSDHIELGVGVDASRRMIELAQMDRPENLTFIQHDWADSTPELPLASYDLVIANRCPAVRGLPGIERLEALSDRWCIYASPTYKHNDFLDTVLARLPGSPPQKVNMGASRIGEVVGSLLASGRKPLLTHTERVSERSHSREEFKRQIGMHVEDYGEQLFTVIDSMVDEDEIIETRLEMHFTLVAWQVKDEPLVSITGQG